MPIGITGNGQTIFTSARDVGNIAAGYIAGINGMSWKASRTAFDAYQSKSSGKPNDRRTVYEKCRKLRLAHR